MEEYIPTNKEMLSHYIQESSKALKKGDIKNANMFYDHAETTLEKFLEEKILEYPSISEKSTRKFFSKPYTNKLEKLSQGLDYNPTIKDQTSGLREKMKEQEKIFYLTGQDEIIETPEDSTLELGKYIEGFQSSEDKILDEEIFNNEEEYQPPKKNNKKNKKIVTNQNKKRINTYISRLVQEQKGDSLMSKILKYNKGLCNFLGIDIKEKKLTNQIPKEKLYYLRKQMPTSEEQLDETLFM